MGIRGEDKKLRFRRTRKEIKMGLTPEKAQKLRGQKPEGKKPKTRRATVDEKVQLIEVLRSKLGFDIIDPSLSKFAVSQFYTNKKRADLQEVLRRIRTNAAAEADKDPLLAPRSRSS